MDQPITIEDLGDAARRRRGATITADAATIRVDAVREFRNHGDANLALDVTSIGDRLADELAKNHPDADARVLRVLAARIARASVKLDALDALTNEDPLLTLTDIAAALISLLAAVAALTGRELSDDDGREALATYRATIDHLRDAAAGVIEMAGWF